MKRNGHNHFTRTKYIHSAYLCPKGNQKRDVVLVLPAIYGQCSPIKRWKKLSRPPSCLHRASEAATLRRNRQKCAKPLAETRNDHAIIVKTKSLFIKRDGSIALASTPRIMRNMNIKLSSRAKETQRIPITGQYS